MYKKQLKAQRILCLVAIIVTVVFFLYSLGIMTDLYDTLYSTLNIKVIEDDNAPNGYTISATERRVSGASVYANMQDFNKTLVKFSIVYIILAVLLFVTNTSSRRRYYITNYISIGLFTAASIFIPIYAHPRIEDFKSQWLNVDFAALKEYAEARGTVYTESTMWFDLHYVVFALMILAALALVACCVWKVILMKEERKLVEEGKKVSA